ALLFCQRERLLGGLGLLLPLPLLRLDVVAEIERRLFVLGHCSPLRYVSVLNFLPTDPINFTPPWAGALASVRPAPFLTKCPPEQESRAIQSLQTAQTVRMLRMLPCANRPKYPNRPKRLKCLKARDGGEGCEPRPGCRSPRAMHHPACSSPWRHR